MSQSDNHLEQARTLDISRCADEDEICAAVDTFARPEISFKVTLVGMVDMIPDLDSIMKRCRENFHALDLFDQTRMLGSQRVKEMARENTVHAIVVKRLLAMSAATDDEHQQHIYEMTLRELLSRFAVMQGDYS